MLSFLEYIVNIIKTLIDGLINTIKSLILAIEFIPQMITDLGQATTFMPAILMPFAALGITFMVLNYVIGRK